MHIVYILPSIKSKGGVERVLSKRTSYFIEKFGYKVSIISYNDNNDLKPFFEYNTKINLYSLSKDMKFQEKFENIQRFIDKINPDILVSINFPLKSFLKLKTSASKLEERHGSKESLFYPNISELNIFKKIKNHLLQLKHEYQIKKLDKYIILTNQDLENWSNKSNIEVIPNALTFDSLEVSSLKNKKIISLGRYTYEKGYDMLIDIWKNVEEVNKEWVLEIYGNGELKEEYEYKIKKLKLQNIYFKTSVKNVKEKLLESSMYVMPSRREGLPMVLLESMTCGLPLISFDCQSGPAELIQEDISGFLIPLFDIQKFSGRILELIQNEDKRQKMGIQSKILSNNFKEDKIMNKWRDLFEKLESKNTRN